MRYPYVCVCVPFDAHESVLSDDKWKQRTCIERILFVDVMDEMAASDHCFCSFDFELIFLTIERETLTLTTKMMMKRVRLDKRRIILLRVEEEDLLLIHHRE